MRRADRLLKVVQILRRYRRPVTARTIADEVEVCERTVYRDIAGLIAEAFRFRAKPASDMCWAQATICRR